MDHQAMVLNQLKEKQRKKDQRLECRFTRLEARVVDGEVPEEAEGARGEVEEALRAEGEERGPIL